MKVALFFLSAVSFAAVVSAQLRCQFPNTWEAFLFESNAATGRRRYALMNYDGVGERISFEDRPPLENPNILPGSTDILLFREQIQYHEDHETKRCTKRPLNETFRPIQLPFDARYMGPLWIGAEEYGVGLKVNLWTYSIPGARHVVAVAGPSYVRPGEPTKCIPIHDNQAVIVPGNPTISRTFFDVREGDNPDHFVPPAGCQ